MNFTLAINRKFNREETDFIDVVVWNTMAENCANYLGKGRLAAVEGRLQVRTYENQEGQKRKITEVVADDVRFLDKGGTSGSTAPNQGRRNNPGRDEWEDLGHEVRMEDVDIVDRNNNEDEEVPF
jgi:single-strand DNA-binding protein